MENLGQEDNAFDKQLQHLKKEIDHEKEEIKHEQEEVEFLEKEFKELEHKPKVFCISVNAEEKMVDHVELCFKKVVELAFGCVIENGNKSYTVTYKKGTAENPEGSMVNGQCVKLKDGMRFNVTQTNKS